MARRIGILFAVSLALAGCKQPTQQNTQFDDSRNPFYQQAEQALANNDPSSAAAAYEAALDANPKLPTAQYQLGILYAEKLQDPVSSIYHFRRYLELAPESDHAINAKDKISEESRAFATSIPNPNAVNRDELTKLQADNTSLQKEVERATHTIEQLQAQLVKASERHHDAAASASEAPGATPADATVPPANSTAASTGDTNTPASSPPTAIAADTSTPAPPRALPLDATNSVLTPLAPGTPLPPGATPPAPSGPSRSYTVVKGDSLWKIAHKMYPGDTKNGVDKIEEANKDALGGKPLKIGQVLVIPQ